MTNKLKQLTHTSINNSSFLFNGECLNIMDELIKNNIKVDAIITDPPYGVTQNKIDIKIPFDDMWRRLKLLRKNTSIPIILFGQGLFFYELVLSNKKEYKYDIIWDKKLTSGFLNAKRMPLRKHENIAVFYKKLPTYNPQFTQGQPLHSKGINYKNKDIKNQNYGNFTHTDDNRKGSTEKYPTSIIQFQKPHPSKAKHPTQKSLELMEWLVKTYTNENDLVLDFTAGSFTTGVACEKLNRKFIGIEINEDYFNLGKNRIKKIGDLKTDDK